MAYERPWSSCSQEMDRSGLAHHRLLYLQSSPYVDGSFRLRVHKYVKLILSTAWHCYIKSA